MKEIKEVSYGREEYRVHGVTYVKNNILFQDETTGIRYGILKVEGVTIPEMAKNLLNAVKDKTRWWSFQTTSISELKASYRAGFRHQNLSSLEQHLEKFKKMGETLHVEINGGICKWIIIS